MSEDQSKKITKSECLQYFKSLMQDAIPKGQEEISKATMKFFQYLAKNYTNLDEEMKDTLEKIKDESLDQFELILKEVPDTPEALFQKRLLRALKKKLPSVNELIVALESPSEIKDNFIIETRKLFEKYSQAWLETLYDLVEESHRGAPSYAKLSLLFSCVDELLCAFCLAQHRYANQTYAHLRTILESINRVELFIKDESYAELWCSDDEARKKKELKPIKVREKLGVKNDSLYSFLCAFGAHPTLEYVKVKSYKKEGLSKNGNPEISFCLGGTNSLNHILHSNVSCILVLMQLLLSTGNAFKDRVHLEEYPRVISDFHKLLREYINNFGKLLKDKGVDTTNLDLFLNDIENWEI